jgi:hypothetical protein
VRLPGGQLDAAAPPPPRVAAQRRGAARRGLAARARRPGGALCPNGRRGGPAARRELDDAAPPPLFSCCAAAWRVAQPRDGAWAHAVHRSCGRRPPAAVRRCRTRTRRPRFARRPIVPFAAAGGGLRAGGRRPMASDPRSSAAITAAEAPVTRTREERARSTRLRLRLRVRLLQSEGYFSKKCLNGIALYTKMKSENDVMS